MFDFEKMATNISSSAYNSHQLSVDIEYALRRAYAAGAASRDVWQPIETVPKDGTYVLLFTQDYKGKVYIDWFTFNGEAANHSCLPTHWMPLPNSPKLQPQP